MFVKKWYLFVSCALVPAYVVRNKISLDRSRPQGLVRPDAIHPEVVCTEVVRPKEGEATGR